MNVKFDVLDPSTDIHQSRLLEASAGTGKTYSIENIVLRLVAEDPGMEIEKILVVTFTRAATRELRQRIRSRMEKAVRILKGCEEPAELLFLKSYKDEGSKECFQMICRLEKALFSFDNSQIFTIHGFCGRMLHESPFDSGTIPSLLGIDQDKQIPEDLLEDFLYAALDNHVCTPGQLKYLVYKKDPRDESLGFKKILNSLKNDASKPYPIYPDVQQPELLNDFFETRGKIPLCISSKVLEDIETLLKQYTNTDENRRDFEHTFVRFATILEKPEWEVEDFDFLVRKNLFWFTCFNPAKIRKKIPKDLPPLHYPDLDEILKENLKPVLDKAQEPGRIYASLAFHLKKYLAERQEEEDFYGMETILPKFHQALLNERFAKQIRNKFQAAIIDEFQDTDPIQWGIFSRLFLNSREHLLYLVGDPKQSIYSFRQADIYTYMEASDAIGKENICSLDTNFRSQPSLVHALNCLFSRADKAGLIQLPRIQKSLPYNPVNAGRKTPDKLFSDQGPCLQFFQGVIKDFPAFIAAEIGRLNRNDGISWSQIAIIVRDKFESDNIANILRHCGIPVSQQKTKSITVTAAFQAMKEVLEAVLRPRNASAIKIALANPLFCWTQEEVKKLDGSEEYENVLSRFLSLREELFLSGFMQFFQKLLDTSWKEGDSSCLESILSRQHGLDLYQDLVQLAEIISEEEHRGFVSPEKVPQFLEGLKEKNPEEEKSLAKRQDPYANAVQILTTFSSKGLEYDIVFASGIANDKEGKQRELILVKRNGTAVLMAPADCSEVERELQQKDVEAEKMRQLYVAFTRAKYRLYVPSRLPDRGKEPMSAMKLFLEKLGVKNAVDLHILVEELSREASIGIVELNEENTKLPYFHEDQTADLSPPPSVKIPGTPLSILSFTSLTRSLQKGYYQESMEASPPHHFHPEEKNPHTLPSGSETGKLLHLLLEHLPYDLATSPEGVKRIQEGLRPTLRGSDFAPWEQTLATMIQGTLTLPIETPYGSFRLCDIPRSKQYRETEFLFPASEPHQTQGYIKGVIDLVFEAHGKIFFLDWKTNWLGPCGESYSSAMIEEAMDTHHYFLQASLYSQALRKYLSVFGRSPFHEIFGGAIYLFLRGAGEGNGAYWFLPKEV